MMIRSLCYYYHPDESRNLALTHAAGLISTGANSRNAADKAQANEGKECPYHAGVRCVYGCVCLRLESNVEGICMQDA